MSVDSKVANIMLPLTQHVCSCSMRKLIKMKTRTDVTLLLYRAPVVLLLALSAALVGWVLHRHKPNLAGCFVRLLAKPRSDFFIAPS